MIVIGEMVGAYQRAEADLVAPGNGAQGVTTLYHVAIIVISGGDCCRSVLGNMGGGGAWLSRWCAGATRQRKQDNAGTACPKQRAGRLYQAKCMKK